MDNTNNKEKYRFKITAVTPDAKKKAIIEAEYKCPICSSDNTSYKTERIDEIAFHNNYVCHDCSSKWIGNAFDEHYNLLVENANLA